MANFSSNCASLEITRISIVVSDPFPGGSLQVNMGGSVQVNAGGSDGATNDKDIEKGKAISAKRNTKKQTFDLNKAT